MIIRNRREFLNAVAWSLPAAAASQRFALAGSPRDSGADSDSGQQRLSIAQLQTWEGLGYGMFIHFGMSTFDGDELSSGNKPSTLYAPDHLDVSQWVNVARDAGMKYAVLTTKHVAGHCLWPTKYTGYNVATSSNRTDVVGAFTKACRDAGIMPGFYYCSWDNHNRFGSLTPTDVQAMRRERLDPHTTGLQPYTTEAYREFQWNQLDELLRGYGAVGEIWIDIPGVLPRDYRNRLYAHMAQLQPKALIMMNHGIGDGSEFKVDYAWPTDLIAIERFLPNSAVGHLKWREIEGKRYYMPGEVCDPIGKQWFYVEGDRPRSDAELLGMYLVTRSRGANLLLDVPPDKHGLIPQYSIDSLVRLRRNAEAYQPSFS